MMCRKFRIETRNVDGTRPRRVRVYDVPRPAAGEEYWQAVTDVPCPCCREGSVRWAEAGHVPGYRICDECGRHFLAKGDAGRPCLVLVGTRRN